MLILLYLVIVGIVVPQLGGVLSSALEGFGVIFIMIAGIVMVFGAVGIRISQNLGSTVVGGLMRGVGFICRSIIQGIGWLFRQIALFLPRVFRGVRDAGVRAGWSQTVSNVVGLIVAFITLVVII